jgi:hypothetical protein
LPTERVAEEDEALVGQREDREQALQDLRQDFVQVQRGAQRAGDLQDGPQLRFRRDVRPGTGRDVEDRQQ